MKLLMVSLALEFPLANYCIAAFLSSEPSLERCSISLLHLDIFKLRDYNQKNTEIWRYVAMLEEEKPDALSFSVYLWNTITVRELVEITHRLYPGIKIILGGPEMATEGAVDPFLHEGMVVAAVRGEGEITMAEIMRRLLDERSLFGVSGCSWWTGRNTFHEQKRPSSHSLAEMPSPYLTGWITEDLFDRLDANGRPVRGKFGRAFLETYRGCYMQCSYCQWGNGTKRRFAFPEDRVIAELSWILSKRVTALWIVDAMFGYKKDLAKKLLRHVIAEKKLYGADTSIVCYHNQDFYDEELFSLYREANVSVEVDLQSTNREVLLNIGRQKWYTDSFDKHLDAFAKHNVPTTGGADLIIGLPLDSEESFSDSVDFLLTRGMHINLYQTSIIPDTPMSRNVEELGIVHSSIAPRAVFKNATFPVDQMVRARLIGHGVDFFRRFPKTAHLLWRQSFSRPVEFCKQLGRLLWERHGLMYGESHILDAVLSDKQHLLRELLPELCPYGDLLDLVYDTFGFEAEASYLCYPPRGVSIPLVHMQDPEERTAEEWLNEAPLFAAEAVKEVQCRTDVDELFTKWEHFKKLHSAHIAESIQRMDNTCLIYLSRPRQADFVSIRAHFVVDLLHRFNGHFTVKECLTNLGFPSAASDVRPLASRLNWLTSQGVITLPSRSERRRSQTVPARRPELNVAR